MKKICTFLCGITAAVLVSGCGSTMPDLTQEEINLISEYAVGVLLKYDKYHSSRLIDTTEYETADSTVQEEEPEETSQDEPDQEEVSANDTEIIDVSQDEEIIAVPATIEEYYGIQDFVFQYTGYELDQNYPPETEEADLFFAMDATEGTQLLVLKFMVTNTSSVDQTLDMLERGARFRVSVNGEASRGALATMLLNDLQTYDDVVPAGSGVELVSIVEVPQAMSIDTIEFVLRGQEENAVLKLQ